MQSCRQERPSWELLPVSFLPLSPDEAGSIEHSFVSGTLKNSLGLYVNRSVVLITLIGERRDCPIANI
jgi:hypothetical protein